MVEFLYEYQGTQYIHWAAVAAVVVVLVYYIKQYYCAEGMSGRHGTQSVYQGAAHPNMIDQEQINFAVDGSSCRQKDVNNVGNTNCMVPDFAADDVAASFLSGREAPVILPYPALGPHQYMKAVHDAVRKGQASQMTSGFYEGMPVDNLPRTDRPFNPGELIAGL